MNETNSNDLKMFQISLTTIKGRVDVLPKDPLIKSKISESFKPSVLLNKLPASCIIKKVNNLKEIPNAKTEMKQNEKSIKTVAVKPIQRNFKTDSIELKKLLDSEDVVAEEIHAGPSKFARFKYFVNLDIHPVSKPFKKKIKRYVPLQQSIEPKSNIIANIEDDDGFLPEKPIVCEICYKGFDTKSPYYIHIRRTHRNKDNLYLCPMCPEKLNFFREIIRHVRDHRGQQRSRNHICDICGVAKAGQSSLEDHRRTHSDQRTLSCHICSATFKTRYILRNHIKRHTGIKNYKCDECNVAFFDCTDYKRHLVKHGLVEKNFHCEICSKSFYERKFLKYHLQKTHKLSNGEGTV